jgi:hypothetical protein
MDFTDQRKSRISKLRISSQLRSLSHLTTWVKVHPHQFSTKVSEPCLSISHSRFLVPHPENAECSKYNLIQDITLFQELLIRVCALSDRFVIMAANSLHQYEEQQPPANVGGGEEEVSILMSNFFNRFWYYILTRNGFHVRGLEFRLI